MLEMSAIHLTHVSKTYPPQSRRALDDIALTVPRGEFLAVRGKSGSGKSTLLNLLGGLDRPSAGTVHVNGQRLDDLSETALASWRGRNVGIVFQFFQLLPTLSGLDNVLMPMEFAGHLDAPRRVEHAKALLDNLGVGDQANKWPATMSGGQQQRVALARALANDPSLVLADEPTGNLDSDSAAQVFRSLAAVAGRGTTIVMITHDAEAASLADRIVELADGRIVSDQRRRATS